MSMLCIDFVTLFTKSLIICYITKSLSVTFLLFDLVASFTKSLSVTLSRVYLLHSCCYIIDFVVLFTKSLYNYLLHSCCYIIDFVALFTKSLSVTLLLLHY